MHCRPAPGIGLRLWIMAGAVLAFGGAIALAKEKAVKLGLALPAGKVLHYKVEMQQESDFRGMTMALNQTSAVEMSRADSTKDGKARIALKFSKIEISMMRGDEIVPYEPELNLEGQTLLAVLSARGEIVDAEPRGILSGWGEEAKRSLMQVAQNLCVYSPGKPVEPGATWTLDLLQPAPAPGKGEPALKGTVEYTLEEIGKQDGVPAATILGKRQAQIRAETPRGSMSGESTGNLEMRVAVDGGWVLESKLSGQVTGTIRSTTGEERKLGQVLKIECKLQP